MSDSISQETPTAAASMEVDGVEGAEASPAAALAAQILSHDSTESVSARVQEIVGSSASSDEEKLAALQAFAAEANIALSASVSAAAASAAPEQPLPDDVEALRGRLRDVHAQLLELFQERHVAHLTELCLLQTEGCLLDLSTFKSVPNAARDQFILRRRVDAATASAASTNAVSTNASSPVIRQRRTVIPTQKILAAREAASQTPPSPGPEPAASSAVLSPLVRRLSSCKQPSALATKPPLSPAGVAAGALSAAAVQPAATPATPSAALARSASTGATPAAATPHAVPASPVAGPAAGAASKPATAAHAGAANDTSLPNDIPAPLRADLQARIKALKANGLWSASRLPKVMEPPRHKAHWDYVLEEAVWMANDFEMERKWKMAVAKKLARAVKKWHEDRGAEAARGLRTEQMRRKKVAAGVARELSKYWRHMVQIAQYRQRLQLDGLKREALDRHLDYMVGATESLSAQLSSAINPTATAAAAAAAAAATAAVAAASGDSTQAPGESASAFSSMEQDTSARAESQPSETVTATHGNAGEATDAPAPAAAAAAAVTAHDTNTASSTKEGLAVLVGAELEDTPMEVNADSAHVGHTSAPLTAAAGPAAKEDVEYRPTESGESDSDIDSVDEPRDAASELAMLQRENEMSIDELRAMYAAAGSAGEESDDGESSSSSASEEIEVIEEDEDDVRAEASEQAKRKHDVSADNEESKRLRSESPQSSLEDSAAIAETIHPRGNSPETTSVSTPVPFLLKHSLRPYQLVGLDWLANMHKKRLNGILADEMGLGKTIQTISFLAHLACEYNNWGPHLIIVPTSVMLNWEMEFKKWCPAFKVLAYHGSVDRRRALRQGWGRPNALHVCITSYNIAVMDQLLLRRKRWRYLILDEAHNIKNFQSKRWQTLLQFATPRRLLLTGTPLQNSLTELWALLHFLMPEIFQSHEQFKEWFDNPIAAVADREHDVRDAERVQRLHVLLRPFILRRLKADVEPQLPRKTEIIVPCSLARRQRILYDEFMARSQTRAGLAGGHYVQIVNIVMQLRKVCNHPNLFTEPIAESPLVMPALDPARLPALLRPQPDPLASVDLSFLGFNILGNECLGLELPYRTLPSSAARVSVEAGPAKLASFQIDSMATRSMTASAAPQLSTSRGHTRLLPPGPPGPQSIAELPLPVGYRQKADRVARYFTTPVPLLAEIDETRAAAQRLLLLHFAYINDVRAGAAPLYGFSLRRRLRFIKNDLLEFFPWDSHTSFARDAVVPVSARRIELQPLFERVLVAVPRVVAMPPVLHGLPPPPLLLPGPPTDTRDLLLRRTLVRWATEHPRLVLPDRNLLQHDCGKLQVLESLLRQLRTEGHRVLIFTQMARMLDILESFLSHLFLTYLRLDGSTKPEQRQAMMERFNADPRIFCFILSTRSGGLGINLTGADTVIFYDSDWNPTIDAQAQDRCHRIGQTRDVSIYRLVSERTIEENILKKAQHKRRLGQIAIESGSFTTEFLDQPSSLVELFEGLEAVPVPAGAVTPTTATTSTETPRRGSKPGGGSSSSAVAPVSAAQLAQAMAAAEDDGDRTAALGVQAEIKADEKEFDESAVPVMTEDDGAVVDGELATAAAAAPATDEPGPSGAEGEHPRAISPRSDAVHTTNGRISPVIGDVTSVVEGSTVRLAAEPAPDATEEARLAAQLARLQPIERFCLSVLERYLGPLHEAQLSEARQAVQAREAQLQQMKERISAQVASIVSDDEEQLFYNREVAYETYMRGLAQQRAAASRQAETYGPPRPDEGDSLYVDPAHMTLYRVAFCAFVPLVKKRKAEPSEPLKLKLHRGMLGNKAVTSDDGRENLGTVSDNITLPSASRHSLFRRKEELRPGALKPPRHPKRPPLKPTPAGGVAGAPAGAAAGAAPTAKKELDSNKDATDWLSDDDWILLQAVRACLSSNGLINWGLVADQVNLMAYVSGRPRSRQQCKDRYFNWVMPLEEGRAVQPEPVRKGPKRKGEPPLPPKGRGKPPNTQRRAEADRHQTMLALHAALFKRCLDARKAEAKGPAARPRRSDSAEMAAAATGQMIDKYLVSQNIVLAGPILPSDPVKLSDQRLAHDRQREAIARAQQAQQSAAAAATASLAATPGANPAVAAAVAAAGTGGMPAVSLGNGAAAAAARGAPPGLRPPFPMGGVAGSPVGSGMSVNVVPGAGVPGAGGVYRMPAGAMHTGAPRVHSRTHELALEVLKSSQNPQQTALVREIYNDNSKSEAVKEQEILAILAQVRKAQSLNSLSQPK